MEILLNPYVYYTIVTLVAIPVVILKAREERLKKKQEADIIKLNRRHIELMEKEDARKDRSKGRIV